VPAPPALAPADKKAAPAGNSARTRPAVDTAATLEKSGLPGGEAEARTTAPGVPVFEPGDSPDEALLILEQWRSSWEHGIIEDYARFYSHDARQGGRGLRQFLAQKRDLWARAKPSSVLIEDITLAKLNNSYQVRFTQTYTDRTGYSDKGVKTLILERRGGVLRIVREDWTPVKN
jgi:hypothetical protein